MRASYSTTPAVFYFNKTSATAAYFQAWYTGGVPANVMNDTGDVGDCSTRRLLRR